MKTIEALSFYNDAEKHVKSILPGLSAINRSEAINIRLSSLYGDEMADEIIELVFEHEFYPVGLNKNE
jgi:hypothetical protein